MYDVGNPWEGELHCGNLLSGRACATCPIEMVDELRGSEWPPQRTADNMDEGRGECDSMKEAIAIRHFISLISITWYFH